MIAHHRNRLWITTAVCMALILLAQSAFAQEGSHRDFTSPFASFRIGTIFTPVISINGGIDVTFPRWGLRRSWVMRADLDISARFASPSFGSRRDATLGVTLCQVYTPQGVNRGNLYLGGGVGMFTGPDSGIGGKLFFGSNLTRIVSLEVEGRFAGRSSAQVMLMLRAAVP